MSKLAAAVILYNPDKRVFSNIESYLENIHVLYVIDNSDTADHDLVTKLTNISKIEYIKMSNNQGVAAALNVACNKAINDGFHWILTMDQDSSATTHMIEKLLSYTIYDNIAIISPYHANRYTPLPNTDEKLSELTTTMTSGNLLNLDLYQTIGPFDEILFIDFVDHDYCLRARQLDYKIIQVNDAILEHNLGNLRQHRLFNTVLYSTNHPSLRKYYIFRNRAYIIRKYKDAFPLYCRRELRRFLSDLFIVILFEKEKTDKLRMMYRGLKDFLKNKMGIYHA